MIENLITQHEAYRVEYKKRSRYIEMTACDVYIGVFKKCKGYIKKNKHEVYLRDSFYDADTRRLFFSASGMDDDSFLQSQIQQALTLVWDAYGLPKGILVKRKRLPLRLPLPPHMSSPYLPMSYS